MKIEVNKIDPNPHRDLKLNPVLADQVDRLVDSIGRTGFWDNIVVRKHPTKDGRYQLAYGHTRLAALKKAKIAEVNLPVRPLSDWEMYECMVDENATQKDRTTAAAYEDVKVGLHLVESFLKRAKNFKEFSEMTGTVVGRPTAVTGNAVDEFEKAKAKVMAGEGIGRHFVEKVLPSSIDSHVIQAVIKTEYGQKITAAKQAEADAKEAEAKAAKSKARAEELRREAAELREQAEAAGEGIVATDLMLQFTSPTVMAQFVSLVKSLGIPKNKHAAAVAYATNPMDPLSLHRMRTELPRWWREESGEAQRERNSAARKAKQERLYKKFGNDDISVKAVEFARVVRSAVNDLATVTEYVEFLNPKARQNLQTTAMNAIDSLQILVSAIELADTPIERVANQSELKQLTH